MPVIGSLGRPCCRVALALALVALAAGVPRVNSLGPYAPLDGVGNNAGRPQQGAAGGAFTRSVTAAKYGDGLSSPRLVPGAPARNVSNVLFGSGPFAYSSLQVSSMAPVWGQLVAHDVARTSTNSSERLDIPVPRCDGHKDPGCAGGKVMSFKRLIHDPTTGYSAGSPRVPLNGATGYLDASAVYGEATARLALLRTGVGGLLKSDPLRGAPLNTVAEVSNGGSMAAPNGVSPLSQLLIGDPRGNVNPGLVALHGAMVLEHNRIAAQLAAANTGWSDETLFQEARTRVMAHMQAITMYEYLPVLVGKSLPAYSGYDAVVDAAPDVFFAIASYRYGHSAINSVYRRVNIDGTPSSAGHLLLRDVYFTARYLDDAGAKGIAPILRGLLTIPENDIDLAMVDDVRNFLEGINGDLAAIDIARGREVGLPSYSDARAAYGLPRPSTWTDINPDADVASALSMVYPTVNDVDAWVGGLAEPPVTGGTVGALFAASIFEQFKRLRDGDRFWFENPGVLPASEVATIKATKLAHLLKRALPAGEIPDALFKNGAFVVAPGGGVGGGSSGELSVSSALKLKWTAPAASDDSVTLTLELQGTGWAAVGFGSAVMSGADIVVVHVDSSGTAVASDRKASGNAEPAVDATNDVTGVTGSETGGVTTVTFTRKLDTGDADDFKLVRGAGAVDVIFAWDTSSDALAYHGASRATAKLDVFDASSGGAVVVSGSRAMGDFATTFGVHAALMFLAWGVLAPLAAFAVRYKRHMPYHLDFHRSAMLGVIGITVASSMLAVTFSPSPAGSLPHHVVGLCLTVLVLLQGAIGSLVRYWHGHFVPPTKFAKLRSVHRWCGRVIVATCFFNMILGVLRYGDEPFTFFVSIWLALLVGAFCGAEVWNRRDLMYHQTGLEPTLDIDVGGFVISQATFRDRLDAGAQWVVYKSRVYDVSRLIPVHPGGTYLLSRVVGMDVEAYLSGTAQVDSQVAKHSHSYHAYNLLQTLCRGKLALADTEHGDDGDGSTTTGPLTKRRYDSNASSPRLGGATVGRPADSVRVSVTADGRVKKHQMSAKAAKLLMFEEKLDLDSSADKPMVWTLVRRRTLSRGKRPVQALTLMRPPDVDAIPFEPAVFGRHMMVHTEAGGHRKLSTPYTLCRWAERDERESHVGEMPGALTLIVRKYPKGRVSTFLHEAPLGESIIMSGPSRVGLGLNWGTAGTLVGICAGTGLVPFIDLIQFVVDAAEAHHRSSSFGERRRSSGSAAEDIRAGAGARPRRGSRGSHGRGRRMDSTASSGDGGTRAVAKVEAKEVAPSFPGGVADDGAGSSSDGPPPLPLVTRMPSRRAGALEPLDKTAAEAADLRSIAGGSTSFDIFEGMLPRQLYAQTTLGSMFYDTSSPTRGGNGPVFVEDDDRASVLSGLMKDPKSLERLYTTLLVCYGHEDEAFLLPWLLDAVKRSNGRVTVFLSFKHGSKEWRDEDPANRFIGTVGPEEVRTVLASTQREGLNMHGVYVCGGPDFTTAFAHTIVPGLGVPKQLIHAL